MKRVEGKNTKSTPSRREADLQPVALDVLKTLVLLQRNYGLNYICRILMGVPSRYWKHTDHPRLETFGNYRGKSREYLKLCIHQLVAAGLVQPNRANCSTLGITEAGKKYLDAPESLIVAKNKLRFSTFEAFIQSKLREFRRDRADADEQPLYIVFGEYTMDQLTLLKPQTYQALSRVPGMNPYKAEAYGAGILAVMNEAETTFNVLRRESLLKRVRQHRYQFVKKLWLDAHPPETISEEVGLTVGTVRRYIRDLHFAGEIDLRPWIEEHVDKKVLFKGAEYFRTAANPRLKEAFDTLGIDYETLRLCQLYVSQIAVAQDAVQLPA